MVEEIVIRKELNTNEIYKPFNKPFAF